jgi:hypothetical protein
MGRNIGHFRDHFNDVGIGKGVSEFFGDHFPEGDPTGSELS